MTNELYQEVTDLSQSPPTATDRSDELLTTDQNILQRKKNHSKYLFKILRMTCYRKRNYENKK